MDRALETSPVNDCAGACLTPFFTQIERRVHSPLLTKALHMLEEDPTGVLSVSQWAQRLGVSREHLTRSLSPVVNPHALLRAARVAIAVSTLVRQDRLAAGRALDSMGYSSRTHAFAVFKMTTGMTPTQFWRIAHDPERDPQQRCFVPQCPLVGALVDRYVN
jgi:AraC-like DNA-binding protein